MLVVMRRVKTSPRLKHTAKPMRIPPSISAEMLTIAVCTHADRAERASMVSVRTVVIMILDSRRPTSTEIRYVKILTIVVLVRLFEQQRRDASENPMRAISVEELVCDVFVGESGDQLAITHFPTFPQERPSHFLSFRQLERLTRDHHQARVTELVMSDGACSMNVSDIVFGAARRKKGSRYTMAMGR